MAQQTTLQLQENEDAIKEVVRELIKKGEHKEALFFVRDDVVYSGTDGRKYRQTYLSYVFQCNYAWMHGGAMPE
ncbi:MAG: hypothetical protein PHS46_08080 [Candidatus Omnitrophica bacterium]|nr:hypothetical protein [Candidatus Omnitrophota bacterium]